MGTYLLIPLNMAKTMKCEGFSWDVISDVEVQLAGGRSIKSDQAILLKADKEVAALCRSRLLEVIKKVAVLHKFGGDGGETELDFNFERDGRSETAFIYGKKDLAKKLLDVVGLTRHDVDAAMSVFPDGFLEKPQQ